MINLTAHLNVIKFAEVANGLSREESERVAAAFPVLFASAFEFGRDTESEIATDKPGPTKTREPKAEPTIDKAALTAKVVEYVTAHPKQRGEDIALGVGPTVSREDAPVFSRTVRGILEKCVNAGTMYADGTKRGRRYWLAAKVEPEAAE